MINDYITRIKANISIYASKKTSNILDGTYTSVYKGRSMNFEDLREYVPGDNVKDIDWKASARTRNLLVRQFIAEKKHNIMLVLDTGKKMTADTETSQSKTDVALMTAGTIGYLANKNGDYVSALYNSGNKVSFFPFKSGLLNLQMILSNYHHNIQNDSEDCLAKSLEYIVKYIRRKMILFIITDLDGMEKLDENLIKKLTTLHDVMIINVGDAYMTGDCSYDIESDLYIPSIVLKNKKLFEMERKLKEDILKKCTNNFGKYRVSVVTINEDREITGKIIDLLERHRYANIR